MTRTLRAALAASLLAAAAATAGTNAAVSAVTAGQRCGEDGKVDIFCTVSGLDGESVRFKFAVSALDPDSGEAVAVSHFRAVRDGGESDDVSACTNGGYHLVWDARPDIGEVLRSNQVVRVRLTDPVFSDKVKLWEDGPFWAVRNAGAAEPWESGLYFWWGDTVGCRRGDDVWIANDGSSSDFRFSETPESKQTSGKSLSTLKSQGWVSADGILAAAHDAARALSGGEWRLPTGRECSDIVDKCDWTWATTNGVGGYVVRGRGDFASASVFLPAAGRGNRDALNDAGSAGYFWSSTPGVVTGNAQTLRLRPDSAPGVVQSANSCGQSVRPVQSAPAATEDPSGDSAPFSLDTTVTLSLTVASAWGEPFPTGGVHSVTRGDTVRAHVSNPEPADGVRHVCTGWTGTGSVPASGTDTNATFAVLEDSALAWTWKTQALVTVSVTGGTCGFGSRWIDLGCTATAVIVPDAPLFSIALAGDTNGVALAGTTLSIPVDGPREIAVTVSETKLASPVHRFYSKAYRGHFFTIDEEEKNTIENTNPNWKYEGVAYRAFKEQASGTTALYRFYSKGYRGHFFTIDAEEAEIVKTNPNWKYEGIAYYVYPSEIEGSVPVFRFWSKAYRHHFYTTNEAEKDDLIAHNPNWKYEGIAFYALPEEETGRAANRGAPGSRALPAADGARGETALPDESFTEAAWTLAANGGAAVAVPGTTEIGGVVVETRADAPDAGELEAGGAGVSPSGELALRLTLPGGAFDAMLWNAAEGPLAGEVAEGALDFALPATGVWHWLRIRDAADGDAFSVWLRAE